MRYEAVIYDAGYWVFLVHPPMVSVLLSASVERFSVSRMRDFFSKSSLYHKPQTVRAKDLKFLENVHPTTCHISHATCNVSHVTRHMSHITCHISNVMCQMSLILFTKLIGLGYVIDSANPI